MVLDNLNHTLMSSWFDTDAYAKAMASTHHERTLRILKIRLSIKIFLVFMFLLANVMATSVQRINPKLNHHNFFKQMPAQSCPIIVTNPTNLLRAAKDSLRCVQFYEKYKRQLVDPENFNSLVSLARVKKTLKFVINTIQQDKNKKYCRITDPTFIRKNFTFVQWNADWKTAQRNAVKMPHNGTIRLTTYGVFEVNGSHRKTANYPCGLYQLLDHSISKKYTKQQILAGILEKKVNKSKRKAFAWVSRQSLEDALMHGTVHVKFADSTSTILNVLQHNGIAYDKKQKNMLKQKRYWFFTELKGCKRSLQQKINQFKQRKDVIFAGDVENIGFGKAIALTYQNPVTKRKEMRIGILADTGGAFTNNLYQLDLFGGIFKNHVELRKHLKKVPSSASACVLYKM